MNVTNDLTPSILVCVCVCVCESLELGILVRSSLSQHVCEHIGLGYHQGMIDEKIYILRVWMIQSMQTIYYTI